MNFRKRKADFENFDLPTFLMNPKVADFVGKDFDKFKEIWLKDYEKADRDFSRIGLRLHWTWLGVIIGPYVWFSYRRMGEMALATLLFFAGLEFIREYMDLGIDTIELALFDIFVYAVFVVFALLGKSLYLHHIIKFFGTNDHVSGMQLDELIEDFGRTSVTRAILFFIFSIMVLIAANIMGDITAGHEISFFADIKAAFKHSKTE